jgi:hypothetical protein
VDDDSPNHGSNRTNYVQCETCLARLGIATTAAAQAAQASAYSGGYSSQLYIAGLGVSQCGKLYSYPEPRNNKEKQINGKSN